MAFFVVLIFSAVLWQSQNCQAQPKGAQMSSQIHYTRIQDISIAYKEYGPVHDTGKNGLPLLMITGYGGLMEMWPQAMVQSLAGNRRVIMFDNRGLGFSTSSEQDYSIELFAQDAAALLNALNIQQAHVLGWSMGSFIAQELALRHPRKVCKLILLAGSCGGSEAVWPDDHVWDSLTDLSGTLEERIKRMFSNLFPQDWLQENPDPSTYFPPVTAPVDDQNLLRQARTLKSWPGSCSKLPKLNAQTLIITGSEDFVIPRENADLLAQRIPNASVLNINNGGHGFFFQFPELTAQSINVFLGDE